jgi:DNA-binding XRE family transcriptional regulator
MVIASPASDPIAPGRQNEFAQLLREIRQALSITRTQVAHATGLSLFIIVAVENGTIAHLQPYVPILARGYRLDEYIAQREEGPTENDGPVVLASCPPNSDHISETRPAAAPRARRAPSGAGRSLRAT